MILYLLFTFPLTKCFDEVSYGIEKLSKNVVHSIGNYIIIVLVTYNISHIKILRKNREIFSSVLSPFTLPSARYSLVQVDGLKQN